LEDLTHYIPISNDLKSDFKVGLDFGGGATCNYVNRLFEIYKIKHLSINDSFGFSSRGPDPTSNPLTELRELVKLNNLNFGFAFDMDGDRLVIVNNKGESLSPDLTLLLCISGAIHNKIKKFVISLDSSITVEKYIKEYGGEVFYSKVGESNVIKKITEVNAESGGEGSSGGFIMPNFTSCRDGLLASIIVCSLDQKIIDECLDLSSNFIQIRTKLPIKPEIKLNDMLEKISKVLTPYSNHVIDEDGFKFVFDDNSWALVRPSNTEHVLRVSLEAEKNHSNSLHKLIYNKIYEIYEKI
jgi:phosphomannomutase